MTANALNLAAIICYFASWLLITQDLRKQISKQSVDKKNFLALFLWLIGLSIHIIGIHFPLFEGKQLTMSFITLGSYVMWFISLILFVTVLRRKVHALAVAILPITILSIVLPMIFSGQSARVMDMHSGLGVHILVSLLAYSVLMLASFQAVLLAAQNHHLHDPKHLGQHQGFLGTLPSLEDMEYFLFRLIVIGVVLLTIGLITGFYFLDNLFGSQVAHKTILSIISWFIFSALLLGRWKYGWRGKTAVRWTLAGFIVLALAFFGTKFIQEFILNS